MRNAPSIKIIIQSGILHGAKGLPCHKTQEDIAEEFRRILKCEKTGRDILSDDYPSVAEYRKHCARPQRAMVRMLALSDLIGAYGVESVETENTGEWADYVNTGDTYAPTVVFFRGTYRLSTLGDFIERSRVKFR